MKVINLADKPPQMPKEPGWLKDFRQIDETSGGSSLARGYVEGQVVLFSQFGEIAVRTDQDKELWVDFVDLGVTCIYSSEGKLAFISLELSTLFSNLSDDDLDQMVNNGEDILGFITDLENNGEEIYLGVYPPGGDIRVNLEGASGTIAIYNDHSDDFSKGFGGDITMGEYLICYHVISQGDEFKISIGERQDDKRTVTPISVSHQLNLKKFYGSKNPNRYHELARSVLLNR